MLRTLSMLRLPMPMFDTDEPTGGGYVAPKTQEELDAIIANRLGREKAKQTEFLKKHGFEKQEDFEVAIKTWKESDEAKKTETQKAQDEANRLKKEKEDALLEARKVKREAALERKAMAKDVDPAKLDIVRKLADIPEDATDEDIATAIDKVLKDVPSLKKTTAASKKTGMDVVDGDPDFIDISKLTEAQIADPKIWEKLMKQSKKK